MMALGRAGLVEHVQHGHEHVVAGLVPLVVVEQREVVDVDEGDADRPPSTFEVSIRPASRLTSAPWL